MTLRLPLLLCLASLGLPLAACDRSAPPTPPPTVDAPSGQGAYVDGEGVRRTRFELLGTLAYDQTVEGALPPAASLQGYEFFASAGDAPSLTLTASAPALLAVYGPRAADGLWGEPIAVAQGPGPLTVALDPLTQGGAWFALVRDGLARDASGAPYALTLRCEGCAAPACTPAPCDQVCADGFVVDAEGCRLCACAEPVACDPACAEGETCQDGVCRPLDCAAQCDPVLAPVCGADGRTQPNACVAECRGVAVVAQGPCPDSCRGPADCAAGEQCDAGRCVPDDCGCERVTQPVCSDTGRTHRNACLLACAGETLRYPGECVPLPCDGDGAECPEGFSCEVAPIPGNLERCRRDPEAADCVRGCLPQRCRTRQDCGRSGFCYPTGEGEGVCLNVCRLGAGCPGDAVCADVIESPGVGVCLPGCDPEAPAPCGPDQRCAADAAGAFTCQREGDCEPGEPGCGEVDPGSCGRCPADSAPVCGADGALYLNACLASCREVAAARPASCYDGPVPPTACGGPGDCQPTGCDDTVCAAAPTDTCARLTPEAACLPAEGRCGCVAGQCRWQPTEDSRACLGALGLGRPPPP